MSSCFEGRTIYGSPGPNDIPDSIPQNCSIPKAANQALRACKTTCCALGYLRDSLIKCQDCVAVDRCELHEHFNQLVDQALSALNEEWGW